MDKLASVSSIVADVGELCRSHDLIEEDLPKGLWANMKTLRRCLAALLFCFLQSYVDQVSFMRLRARSESAER
jgi:hypothetical protein